jgi:hypothetical protein
MYSFSVCRQARSDGKRHLEIAASETGAKSFEGRIETSASAERRRVTAMGATMIVLPSMRLLQQLCGEHAMAPGRLSTITAPERASSHRPAAARRGRIRRRAESPQEF